MAPLAEVRFFRLADVFFLGIVLDLFLRIGSAQAGEAMVSLEWKAESRRLLVADATYGRIKRLSSQVLLCSLEKNGQSWVMRSTDEARSWSAPLAVGICQNGAAANPELCVLTNMEALLFWNDRPAEQGKSSPYAIRLSRTRDGGRTWQPQSQAVFTAGTVQAEACWEPAAVSLPNREVQLFFARELPGQQEIATMHSLDGGQSWSAPRQASLRAGRRDGMPVPLLLAQGSLVYSIEDNGIAGQNRPHPPFRPSIIQPESAEAVGASSSRRWLALAEPPADSVNVAAPYLARLPSGETLLSAQSNEDEPRWHRMVVYVGDASARHFGRRTLPFGLPPGSNCEWNSLFVKDTTMVLALTHAECEGRRGLWCVEGRILRNADPRKSSPPLPGSQF